MKNKKPSLIIQPHTSLANQTGPWRTQKPVTDQDICISCSLCAKICPENCIVMQTSAPATKLKPQTDYDYCKGCGLCAHECPVKAIKMIADY